MQSIDIAVIYTLHFYIMVRRTLKLPVNKSFFLFGPRQTGKTTLINSVFKDKVYGINLLLSDQFFKYSKDPSLLRREVIGKKEKHKARLYR